MKIHGGNCSSTGPRHKKLRRTESLEQDSITGEDRLSNLPEGLIDKILSYVHIKDAARTSVLSKNWTYKWTSLSSFNINVECKFRHKIDPKFRAFMNGILHVPAIKNFRLSCYRGYNSHHLKAWISSILRHTVDSLVIKASECADTIVLPQSVFNWTSLTELELSFEHGILEVPLNKCFSQLKSLSIGDFEIQNVQTSRHLLLDFPVLEKLELNDCQWLNVEHVEVKAPKLNIFNIKGMYQGLINNCVIKVSTGNLAVFQVEGAIADKFYVCLESVYYASLMDFSVTKSSVSQLNRILKAVVNLTHLELLSSNIEALIQAKPGLVLPLFDGLKHLEIFGTCKVKELLEFLETTPHLETISLDLGYRYPTYDYKKVEFVPPCIVSHLKEVTITGFCGWKNQVKLTEFILKNATILEKVIVFVYTSSKSVSDIENMLLGLAKSSTSAAVVVNSGGYNKRKPAIHI